MRPAAPLALTAALLLAACGSDAAETADAVVDAATAGEGLDVADLGDVAAGSADGGEGSATFVVDGIAHDVGPLECFGIGGSNVVITTFSDADGTGAASLTSTDLAGVIVQSAAVELPEGTYTRVVNTQTGAEPIWDPESAEFVVDGFVVAPLNEPTDGVLTVDCD